MKKEYRTEDLMNHILSENFVRSCNIPLGYSAVFPIVSRENGKVVLTVPFHKTKRVRETGEELLYPIRYLVRCVVREPEELSDTLFANNPRERRHLEKMPFVRFVGFEDLAWNKDFAGTDFDQPVSAVRPNRAVAEKRREKVDALILKYDEWIGALVGGAEKPSLSLLDSVRTGLSELLDNTEKEMYRALDAGFAETFLF